MHNEELYDLYCSAYIMWVIESRTLRWVGHVACMVEKRNVYMVVVGNLKESDHLEYLGIRRIILKS